MTNEPKISPSAMKAAEEYCGGCKTTKPILAFSIDRSRPGGFAFWCKHCHSSYNKNHRDEINLAHRNWSKRNRSKILKKDTRLKSTHPGKVRAKNVLNGAVRRGKLTRQPCNTCGVDKRTQGHHNDYSKPLDVVWLCPPCHSREHQLEDK